MAKIVDRQTATEERMGRKTRSQSTQQSTPEQLNDGTAAEAPSNDHAYVEAEVVVSGPDLTSGS
jgi:hypothetical protein